MLFRRIASVVAIALGSVPLLGAPAAADVALSGWTDACFGPSCVPSTQSSLQFSTHLGLIYVNATFAASTASDMLTLGGSPGVPNVDNLGSFMLDPGAASYEGTVLDLRVLVDGASVAVPAVLHGAVAPDASGGVVVDFDNGPRTAALSDGTTVAVTVQDVSLVPGATVALGGTVTTGAVAPPTGAVVPEPGAGAPPLHVLGDGFAGATAGGVLALVLGAVDVPGSPAVHAGEPFAVSVDLTAPVAAHAAFSGAVTGTVVASGTGAYLIDFPDAPVSVDLGDGSVLVVSVNDLAVAPGHSATVTGQIVQPPSNKAPVAVDDTYTRHRGNHGPVVTTGVLANDADADGDPLAAELVQGPRGGTVVFRPDGTFSYAPRPNFQDDDAFTYRVFDGLAWSDPATVTISIEKAKSGR
ncbi:MAG: large repetitive protein [Actinomycetota bacterium]|jgi:hypothetical protein